MEVQHNAQVVQEPDELPLLLLFGDAHGPALVGVGHIAVGHVLQLPLDVKPRLGKGRVDVLKPGDLVADVPGDLLNPGAVGTGDRLDVAADLRVLALQALPVELHKLLVALVADHDHGRVLAEAVDQLQPVFDPALPLVLPRVDHQ